jgi:hypothetical protein
LRAIAAAAPGAAAQSAALTRRTTEIPAPEKNAVLVCCDIGALLFGVKTLNSVMATGSANFADIKKFS